MTPNRPTNPPAHGPTNSAPRRLSDAALDDMLGRVRDRTYPGPDHNPRVDAFLSEQHMNTQRKHPFSKTSVAIGIAALVCGGAVAAAVTHRVMSQRATLITDDGTEYEIELLDTPEGAAGTFVMDDGTVYGVDMVKKNTDSTVTVDVSNAAGGTSSVTLNPDEEARAATFIDEDGIEHEVDPSAADTWVSDPDPTNEWTADKDG